MTHSFEQTDAFKLALKIVSRLARTGHIAYFAGGWVRDYVMGKPSEDIDIATSATPAQIMDLFPRTLLVGLSFGVVIVVMEGHQFEVATFRKDLDYVNGRKPEGIELSTPQEDALRRDFTINGMFYDPLEKKIHDYVGGQQDIQKRIIRTIGDPHERFFEDRLRMLRAFRFSARFGFSIEPETQEAIRENAPTLFPAVALERIWQEFNKMAAYARFDQAVIEMHRLSLLEIIFPELQSVHLHDVQQRVASYARFPSDCPTILYLMELFPAASVIEKIEIGRRLKATVRDLKLVEFSHYIHQLVLQEKKESLIDDHAWATAMSHPDFRLCLDVILAKETEENIRFLHYYYMGLSQRLHSHIQRIKEKKPLVSSALLVKCGIQPGKKMGMLLAEAEKIAINQNLHDPVLVLEQLKEQLPGQKKETL